uniref:Peptidase_M14 domain-containing protein n=1 Tax=Parastrongyloides trichosuri TaxID=131310 RepID=A0A0N4ZH76_PARTI
MLNFFVIFFLIINQSNSKPLHSKYPFDLMGINELKNIETFMKNISTDYSSFITLESFGKSYEGNDMLYLKINYNKNIPNENKSEILVYTGSHGHELVTQTIMLNLINELKNEKEYKDKYNNLIIYLSPVINPDGYLYQLKFNKLWRKNRSRRNHDHKCIGVDINRNFNIGKNDSITDSAECSDSYGGTNVLEPETNNIVNFFKNHSNIKAFIDLHTNGPKIMYPYSYSSAEANDTKAMNDLAHEMSKETFNKTKTKYEYGSIAKISYMANGVAIDYAKSIGIKYTFAIAAGGKNVYMTFNSTNFQNVTSEVIPMIHKVMLQVQKESK